MPKGLNEEIIKCMNTEVAVTKKKTLFPVFPTLVALIYSEINYLINLIEKQYNSTITQLSNLTV